MQLVKAPRDALLRPLQVVVGIVERRQTLPILANVLLRKDGETLSMTTSDLEIQIRTAAQIGSGADNAATTVSARKLADILRALPEADVKLDLSNRKLTLLSGRSRFNLQTLAAEEYPAIAQGEFVVDFSLPAAQLKYLLSMVHFSMAAQDIRYYLNGMLLVVEPDLVRAVATDGHRMALCEVDKPRAEGRVEAILPRKTVLELMRLLPDGDDPVRVQLAAAQARFSFGPIELVSKLVEGKFPDYTKVIPLANHKTIIVNRDEMMQALTRAAILTTDKFKGVRCALGPGSMKISSTNADLEDAQEELEIEYGGEALDIGFNVVYLLDVMNNLRSDGVKFAFGDALGSVLISMPDSERFKYVVMPMRI